MHINTRTLLGAILTMSMTLFSATAFAQQAIIDDTITNESQLAVLQSPDSDLHAKAVACKNLAIVGEESAIPALAALLDSNDALAYYARYGLEAMPFPAVDDALRKAAAELDGLNRIGVINSIGERQDTKAIPMLNAMLDSEDTELKKAAYAALCRIGSPDSWELLGKTVQAAPPEMKPALGDSLLGYAEERLAQDDADLAEEVYAAIAYSGEAVRFQAAGLYGIVKAKGDAAGPFVVELLKSDDPVEFEVGLAECRNVDDPNIEQTLVARLDGADSAEKAVLLATLGDVGTQAVLPVLVANVQDGPLEVRSAALGAIARLADASTVNVLLPIATGDDEAMSVQAIDIITSLDGVDDVLVGALSNADTAELPVIIELVGLRRIGSATPALLSLSEASDEKARLAAIEALGQVISLEQLGVLTDRVTAPKTEAEATAAKASLKTACTRLTDRTALAKELATNLGGTDDAKIFFVELLGTVGGDQALKELSTASKSDDPILQDAGTRVLGEWMSTDAAPILLDIATTHTDKKYRVRTLRGYVRIVRQLDLSDAERLAMCGKAMAAAERYDERNLALEVMGRIPTKAAMAAILPHLQNAGSKEAAAKAAVALSEKLIQTDKGLVAAAMQQVLAAGPSKETADHAKLLLGRAGG